MFYSSENKDLKEKLEEFKVENYFSIDEMNIPSLQSDNAIDYVELNNEDSCEKFDSPRTGAPTPPPPLPDDCNEEKLLKDKRQPPPVMKKPEKSDEILRKLGRTTPLDSVSQQTFGTISSLSSTSSSIHDHVSRSSSSNNEATCVTAVRLSHSKATDV